MSLHTEPGGDLTAKERVRDPPQGWTGQSEAERGAEGRRGKKGRKGGTPWFLFLCPVLLALFFEHKHKP